MYRAENLKDELVKKLEREQKEYLDKIKEKGIDYVVERAYEITSRQCVIDYIECSEVKLKNIKVLLSTEDLLDDLYNEWLKTDANFYEQLEYCIEDRIESLSDEFYNKDDKDVEQENKSNKTQNKARDCR